MSPRQAPCFPTCGPLPRPSRREPVNTCAPLPRGFLLSPKLAWLLARQAGWRSWGTNPRRSCAHGKHPKTNASWCRDAPAALPSSWESGEAPVHPGSRLSPVDAAPAAPGGSWFHDDALLTELPSSSHTHSPACVSVSSHSKHLLLTPPEGPAAGELTLSH